MWTWYAVANARFLRRPGAPSAAEWSSIVGVASLVIALTGSPIAWAAGWARDPTALSRDALLGVAFWSVALGAGATWLGTVFFNMASTRLQTTVMGQLIIFEAAFGALYVWLISGRPPQAFEALGVGVALVAVWMTIRATQRGGGR